MFLAFIFWAQHFWDKGGYEFDPLTKMHMRVEFDSGVGQTYFLYFPYIFPFLLHEILFNDPGLIPSNKPSYNAGLFLQV